MVARSNRVKEPPRTITLVDYKQLKGEVVWEGSLYALDTATLKEAFYTRKDLYHDGKRPRLRL